MKTTKYNREDIVKIIEGSDKAVERAILAIFRRQTQDEQVQATTKHSNGVGFAGCDAHYGTYCAKWVLSGKHLSGSHLEKCRKLARKYVRQLVDEANAKLAAKASAGAEQEGN